ncbi:hypothetical protein A9G07_04830 [Gilliamella sp. wkB72]|uniref:pyridoxamine 5'-phosphate oxidase family protein n=1 Tax=Gilliamella sp. wkB72 TaxID=3120265 RepID=UPI000810645C|nr:pyridoxamine 5'-phosphate oxidase family protein [Gilliamella apicola]OCL24168.1 hypothetical protein A9G07_04830 [Gilliamella apicola]
MKSSDHKIVQFIKQQHVLSLSLILAENQPWSCNAFYVFDEVNWCLYFLSELKTQHAQAMLKNPNVAGTISISPKSIAKIQGIQFTGNAQLLAENQASHAYKLYYHAFPFARVMKAPIWSIQLQQIKMTNNLMGFAHKTHWQRNEDL